MITQLLPVLDGDRTQRIRLLLRAIIGYAIGTLYQRHTGTTTVSPSWPRTSPHLADDAVSGDVLDRLARWCADPPRPAGM